MNDPWVMKNRCTPRSDQPGIRSYPLQNLYPSVWYSSDWQGLLTHHTR